MGMAAAEQSVRPPYVLPRGCISLLQHSLPCAGLPVLNLWLPRVCNCVGQTTVCRKRCWVLMHLRMGSGHAA